MSECLPDSFIHLHWLTECLCKSGPADKWPRLRLDGVINARGCEVVWVWGYDIVYSRREKIICPPVIGLFYGSHSPQRLERWKLIKTKGEESSEDALVLPPLLSSLPSVLRKIILNCAARGGDHFMLINMYVHSVQMIWVELASLHRGQVKRMVLLPPWVLFFLLLFADIRLPSFWGWSMERVGHFSWSSFSVEPQCESESYSRTAANQTSLSTVGRAVGQRFHRSHPNWFPSWHKQTLPRKPVSWLTAPLPFLPMTSHNVSISCESSIITRQRAALPVQPLFCGTRCVLSANHRWSLTSVRGCCVKAVIVQGQKGRTEGNMLMLRRPLLDNFSAIKMVKLDKSEWKNVWESVWWK